MSAGSRPHWSGAAAVREALGQSLRLDLVGPDPDEPAHEVYATEVLPSSPSTWYLTGFLVPFQAAEADETSTEQMDMLRPKAGADDDAPPERASTRKAPFPSSIGLSLLVPAGLRSLDLSVTWGDYRPLPQPAEAEGAPVRWQRQPGAANIRLHLDERARQPLLGSGGLAVQVACREVRAGGGAAHPLAPAGTRAVSVFVVNQRPPAPDVGRDAAFAFQVRLVVESELPFVNRPDHRGHAGSERDEQVAELQYRDTFEYAVGHGVATVAELAPDGSCRRARTEWVPTADVERVEPCRVDDVVLQMEALAALPDGAAAARALLALPDRYAAWIGRQRDTELDTEPRRRLSAELLDQADNARRRIEAGIALLDDPKVLRAFTLANRVMASSARQRVAVQSGRAPVEVEAPVWRPFQLAFLLLNLRGVVEPTHDERETVDLLFFPTGGGKTEAYLGLAAFTLIWRRLSTPGVGSAGLSVLMRYTLRLLTFDQLGRAAALICALELERQRDRALLGDWPFEIGLWVGKGATPNRMGSKDQRDPDSAKAKVEAFMRGKGPSPIPLEKCPWCGTRFSPTASFDLRPNANYPTDLRLLCMGRGCPFHGRNALPILTVDEPIYRRLPCFLVATVDKFAQLPWVGESGKLLGKAERYDAAGFYGATEPGQGAPLPGGTLPGPDLIIQDELHLISGPLGTIVGLYETAIDALCTRTVMDGAVERRVRPKIVASTATVRRAERQIQALFGRPAVEIFPPPGPDRRDSFFAETVAVERVAGRRYLGVAAQGRSLKVVFLRTLLALMGAAQRSWELAGGKRNKDNPADPYMSMVAYFNSLRELGGSRRIVEDEVASRLSGYALRRRAAEEVGPFSNRRIGQPVELTSRESTSKVANTKERLEQTFHSDDRVDVALATNMISVGLDIIRLGLMVVVGQPKMSAEYIQATSRVGRDPKRPGLVVTLMNLHRPRDRSHYERFAAWHASFYRSVEATSVTPFSPRAIDRAIAGVVVTLARQGLRSLTPSAGAVQMRLERSKMGFVSDAIGDRAALHRRHLPSAEQEELRQRLRGRVGDLLDDWVKIADRKNNLRAGLRYQRFEPGSDTVLLRDPLTTDRDGISVEERRFKAHRSMRDVELSVNLWAKTLDGHDVEAESE